MSFMGTSGRASARETPDPPTGPPHDGSQIGFNLRATGGHVVDGTFDVFLPSSTLYPTSFSNSLLTSITAGYVGSANQGIPTAEWDETPTPVSEVRLGGSHSTVGLADGEILSLRMDALPGTYVLRTGMGSALRGSANRILVYDGVTAGGVGIAQLINLEATGNDGAGTYRGTDINNLGRLSGQDFNDWYNFGWFGLQVTVTDRGAETGLLVQVGTRTGQVGPCNWCHVNIEPV